MYLCHYTKNCYIYCSVNEVFLSIKIINNNKGNTINKLISKNIKDKDLVNKKLIIKLMRMLELKNIL